MVHAAGSSALEQFADELGSGSYATILTGSHAPTLRVVRRRASRLAEDIHTGDGRFCGASAGLTAPCGDISAVVAVVTRTLRNRAR